MSSDHFKRLPLRMAALVTNRVRNRFRIMVSGQVSFSLAFSKYGLLSLKTGFWWPVGTVDPSLSA